MAYEQYWRARKARARPFNQYTNWHAQILTLKLSKAAAKRLAWIIYYETTAQKNASLVARHFGRYPKSCKVSLYGIMDTERRTNPYAQRTSLRITGG
jgi:hypothetical protein